MTTSSNERGDAGALGPDVEALWCRIEQWRATKQSSYSPMPPALWDAAVEAAAEHGVYATSKALRVSDRTLRNRLGQRAGERRGANDSGDQFVELSGADLLGGSRPPGVSVQLARPDGVTMTICLAGDASLDARAWVDAFTRAAR